MSVVHLHTASAVYGPWTGFVKPCSAHARRAHPARRCEPRLQTFIAAVDRLFYAAAVSCVLCVVAVVFR
jgi:hypothetical protein